MAQIDLGKLKFNWRGDWLNSSSYEIDDVVYYNGSAYVAVQNNTASNPASQHALGTAWEKMTEGINYAGDWTSGTTYFKGDLVRWNNASYLLVAGTTSGLYTTTNPSAIPTVWKILVNAPSATVLNASGGMIFRDNDDTTNVQLPIGALGSQLSVIEKPLEDIANEGNYEYTPVLLGGTRNAWLTGDGRETYEAVTYTVTVAAVNNQNQFHLSGGSLSGTVERPTIPFKIGGQYTFDVSDSSNTGHVFAFKYWNGNYSNNSAYNFVNATGYNESDFGIVRNGTAGSAGATIVFTPTPAALYILRYGCSVHSAMTEGEFTTSFSTSGNNGVPRIYRKDGESTAVNITRGKSYSFTFPANGLTYSIKNPAASGYSGAGNGGRITDGSAVPQFVTNGGTITYTPPVGTTIATVIIRDEANQADSITLSLKDLKLVPSWAGTTTYKKHIVQQPYNVPKDLIKGFCHWPNATINNYTETLWALPAYLKRSGRGFLYGTCTAGYRRQGAIGERQYFEFGNHYHRSGYDYTYGSGYGVYGQNAYDGSHSYPASGCNRTPKFWEEALAGHPDYAHLLTDLSGNTLDLYDQDGKLKHNWPRLMQMHKSGRHGYQLFENGMVMAGGYGGYGLWGNGATWDMNSAAMGVVFFDDSGARLSGANHPKIKFICFSAAQNFNGDSDSYYSVRMLDTNGKMYTWGYNGYGQLGDNSTNNNYYAKQMPMSRVGNEKIIYVCDSGYRYTSVYAITESGKLYSWGRNGNGQLGIGNTSDQTTPQEMTAVTGSPLVGKKVVHVIANQDGDDEGKVWILTDEGKVYFCGYHGHAYGASGGVYGSSAGNLTLPELLTNSSTQWNSNNQKVIYMACTNNRYTTLYFITDGGTTGYNQKVYATGYNSYGQQGTGRTTSANNNSTDWFGAEIQFRDFGDPSLNTNGSNNSRPNEVIGTLHSFRDDTTHANYRKLRIGTIVKIHARGGDGEDANRVVLEDDEGRLFVAGYWNYIPVPYYEADGNNDCFEDGREWTDYFVPWWGTPETIIEGGFTHHHSGSGETGSSILTKSGEWYRHGESSWYMNGDYHSSSQCWLKSNWNQFTGD